MAPFIPAVCSQPGIRYRTKRESPMPTSSVTGFGRQTKDHLKLCLSWSPPEPGMTSAGIKGKPCPVQCNRPYGHEGNHMTLMGNFDRLAEWEPARIVK